MAEAEGTGAKCVLRFRVLLSCVCEEACIYPYAILLCHASQEEDLEQNSFPAARVKLRFSEQMNVVSCTAGQRLSLGPTCIASLYLIWVIQTPKQYIMTCVLHPLILKYPNK
jgi:hypothetical protein